MMEPKLGAAVVAVALAAIAAGPAGAQSAPDAGRAFEPMPRSTPLYDIQAPDTDPVVQRQFIDAADGADLFVETWLPKAKDGHVPPARLPTILVISPYVAQGVVDGASEGVLKTMVPRGYAYTQVHVRGTGESGGCIDDHGLLETDDGIRTVDWIARQATWSNGIVGGFGLSWPGGSIFAPAASGDPRVAPLKAIVVGAPVASRYSVVALDGVPQLVEGPASIGPYLALSRPGRTTTPQRFAERPRCFGPQHRQLLLDDPSGDFTPYYQEREHRDGAAKVTAATLMFHGLQDTEGHPSIQAGLFDRIRSPKHGLFGVFEHALPSHHRLRREWERADWLTTVAAWYDKWLQKRPRGARKPKRWPIVQIQGTDGQWRAERDWPATGGPRAQLGIGAGGVLGATSPAGSTQFTELELESTNGQRSDVSAAEFRTPPLPDRLEITGQPVLDTWVTLDRPDAHLAAAFAAYDAQGRLIPGSRVYGARSARHLDPFVDGRFAQATQADPPVGVPVRVPIRLQPADVVVPKGGTLRLVVAGSVDSGRGLNELAQYFGQGDEVDLDPVGLGHPTQPSGTFTRVTLHHDCAHPTALRFLLPHADADLLNVREKDEPAGEPLADNRGYAAPVTDGGGIARAAVCGSAPSDPSEALG